MAENMGEEFAFFFEPCMNPSEQTPVVADMFKHFHGNHTVESGSGFKLIYISSDHLEVTKFSFFCLAHDVFTLGIGIRY